MLLCIKILLQPLSKEEVMTSTFFQFKKANLKQNLK